MTAAPRRRAPAAPRLPDDDDGAPAAPRPADEDRRATAAHRHADDDDGGAPAAPRPADELAALGAFYGIATGDVIARHGAALGRYAEWVLGRDALAIVTLGAAAHLVDGDRSSAAARFAAAAARWPTAITGMKRELGDTAAPPTYYVRATCPWADGIALLGAAAAAAIPPARTLYGLGFQGDIVKTYALTDDGFISYRIAGDAVRAEPKRYRADVAWDAIAWPDARWTALGTLGRALGFRTAGHVGELAGAMKVYVERVGAIATERAFA